MRRALPPLATLRAFEAAARHQSFKQAAEELAVTPTAISHQIRLLEETLGLRLFERRTRQVALTREGRELYPVLRDGFDAFSNAVIRISEKRRSVVTLSATTSFTARWLVPRVASFRERYPSVDLSLHASDDPVDFRTGIADAAVRYGRGPYPDLSSTRLMANRFAPVCSARLGLKTLDDLHHVTLLHSRWRHPNADTPTWRRWLDAAGMHSIDGEAGISFNDDGHAAQAAIAGQGVALLSLVLVADDLASGVLLQPFGPAIDGYDFHLVHPRNARPEVGMLSEWLLDAVQAAS
ncbi:LysR family transcriptional regulator, glycine cleavage system transcriptional activator [Mesorhizobium albiziae]|uniref:LysR family transcriptional regulator, glycine cleavage system transcriptional activator n=1 Tax=Neomesorhizobium albiziae TaxID=335020 RepID=A0A1I4DZD4_9HYPH|nr:LysR substrate-binding domain-containing protein [Mesorhizobium albiziae]GLS32760.1 LysR family transcriptional regulator [Mesorhizobium albiziae]SFK97466.1 LysR family transcriptional regulator, glycine cleavage system transcriptional activator [Mesorhizobium albiziae]